MIADEMIAGDEDESEQPNCLNSPLATTPKNSISVPLRGVMLPYLFANYNYSSLTVCMIAVLKAKQD